MYSVYSVRVLSYYELKDICSYLIFIYTTSEMKSHRLNTHAATDKMVSDFINYSVLVPSLADCIRVYIYRLIFVYQYNIYVDC